MLTLSDAELVVKFDLTVDQSSLADRRSRQSGPVTNLEVLQLLLRTPVCRTVGVNWSDYESRLLAPYVGTALALERDEIGNLHATRWIRPVLDVESVQISGLRWEKAVAVASRFAPYCSRRVVLDEAPEDDSIFWWEANFHGIGVVTSCGAELLQAAPFTPARYSGASWKFAEQLLSKAELTTF